MSDASNDDGGTSDRMQLHQAATERLERPTTGGMTASANAQATADEADVFEALIASERVEGCIQTIRRPFSAARLAHCTLQCRNACVCMLRCIQLCHVIARCLCRRNAALQQLESWVTKRYAYAEEAR